MVALLTAVWRGRITVSSNTARELAPLVGAAASLGFITTRARGVYTRQWHITAKGLRWLEG